MMTGTPVSRANADQAAPSCLAPNVVTGMTARAPIVRTAARAISGVSSQESGSTSATTGERPAHRTADAVAMNVSAGTRIGAPAGSESARSASSMPAVQLDTLTTLQSPAPANDAAMRASNSPTSGPKFEYQRFASMRRRYGSRSSAVGSDGIISGMRSRTAAPATGRSTAFRDTAFDAAAPGSGGVNVIGPGAKQRPMTVANEDSSPPDMPRLTRSIRASCRRPGGRATFDARVEEVTHRWRIAIQRPGSLPPRFVAEQGAPGIVRVLDAGPRSPRRCGRACLRRTT